MPYSRRNEVLDRIAEWAAHRLPRRLVYFASIRLMVHATVGKWSTQVVPELTCASALTRWTESSDVQ